MLSAKWQQFCLGLNVLTSRVLVSSHSKYGSFPYDETEINALIGNWWCFNFEIIILILYHPFVAICGFNMPYFTDGSAFDE